ncbi:uncharacterized protein Z518_10536 [Rhinocladiella mackenziei CBS 650.93]|uniref:Uncharacterized protein n=1 Tax=Rhinocladiella mackenziei CBS 650.93 TaxID=1442369 RepID=A0A0D2FEA7_9EURO|nr:uncharacterized protein Z518_10536 [Rhinocladiella mackenziei CBS 650.93]KIX00397.1 hypothetical protein Z518_10536 [Rhinocladiella mackenziei CBS 650.93]
MRALWYDVFKDGKTGADASPNVLAEETKLAWSTNVSGKNTRFFNVIQDDNEDIAGAVVHFSGIESYDSLLEFTRAIPWMQHDFAAGKYCDVEHVKRLQPFRTSPTVAWYAVLSAKERDGYDENYGLDDALQAFRLLKSNITEEVFDLLSPDQGKVSRFANDRKEAEGYLKQFLSVREETVDVLILRTKSTCVWDFAFF